MQRNVDALQETNRSLQDFIIYTMKKDSLKNEIKEDEKIMQKIESKQKKMTKKKRTHPMKSGSKNKIAPITVENSKSPLIPIFFFFLLLNFCFVLEPVHLYNKNKRQKVTTEV